MELAITRGDNPTRLHSWLRQAFNELYRKARICGRFVRLSYLFGTFAFACEDSVAEVADAGEDDGDAEAVGGGDDVGVFD